MRHVGESCHSGSCCLVIFWLIVDEVANLHSSILKRFSDVEPSVACDRIALCAQQADGVLCCSGDQSGHAFLVPLMREKGLRIDLACPVELGVAWPAAKLPPQEDVAHAAVSQGLHQCRLVHLWLAGAERCGADIRKDRDSGGLEEFHQGLDRVACVADGVDGAGHA